MYTLMHDPEYRDAISWQNTAYNQPAHLSFLLSDTAKWPKPNISLVNAPAVKTATTAVEAFRQTASATGLVKARVSWINAQGQILSEEEQWVNPLTLRPTPPAHLHGLLLARVSAANQAPRFLHIATPNL